MCSRCVLVDTNRTCREIPQGAPERHIHPRRHGLSQQQVLEQARHPCELGSHVRYEATARHGNHCMTSRRRAASATTAELHLQRLTGSVPSYALCRQTRLSLLQRYQLITTTTLNHGRLIAYYPMLAMHQLGTLRPYSWRSFHLDAKRQRHLFRARSHDIRYPRSIIIPGSVLLELQEHFGHFGVPLWISFYFLDCGAFG